MSFELPPLPYGYDDLSPTISGETMHLHHDKHHAKYFKTMNDLLAEAGQDPATLEEVVVAARQAGQKKLFNNAAQAWNHTFFWNCMSPSVGRPSAELQAAIDQAFGGIGGLKDKIVGEGNGHFGSGWAWLTAAGGALKVDSTHDGENHLGEDGVVPLLTCDVWEHAYYVDYRNDREAFIKAWFDAVVNWDFASRQFAAAQGQGEIWKHPGKSA